MRTFKRSICMMLSLAFLLQLLCGCSSPKTDEEIYLTRGEFFSYFVYENQMTSEKYSTEEIQSCTDGSVEAAIIEEWEYLAPGEATANLNKPVDKETVVTVCANATFDLKKGNMQNLKDAKLLDQPQTIADAYASGFFELENGYFDGAQKMSFSDCEEIMAKARAYAANFHFEANSEVTTTAAGVIEQEDANYVTGDVVVEFFGNGTDINSLVTKITDRKTEVKPLEESKKPQALNEQSVSGFTAVIKKSVFEINLGNPSVGDTVVFSRYDLPDSAEIQSGDGEILGELISKSLEGDRYTCVFDYPEFEEAVEKKNLEEANGTGIDTKSFQVLEKEVYGWNLSFDVTSGSVKVSAEKDFTVYETGRKQDWQNAKKTVTATAGFAISDFNIDVKNLKSFAKKNGEGYIKITCDTNMDFSLSTSLRYTPDSNRNGKFPSNWCNSRWTDNDSKGATSIKIAKFSPSLYGVAGAEIYIYLQVAFDGSVSFSTSIDDGGVQISANNGKFCITKLGTKTNEFHAKANIYGRFGIDATLELFCFINVIEYDVGADVNITATVDLYYEDSLSKAGVCADIEGLDEYATADSKFDYCISVVIELAITGKLQKSAVKSILDLVKKGKSLDFKLPVGKGGIHVERSGLVDECTRGKDQKELEATKANEILLTTYKIHMNTGESETVQLVAVPSKTMELIETSNAIVVTSGDESICAVTYDSVGKRIIIEAVGDGSTEIMIYAKTQNAWWKKNCEQKISVTVSPAGVSA